MNRNGPGIIIVGHPRSLTSLAFRLIRDATGLRTPAASAGELLNIDRSKPWKHPHFSRTAIAKAAAHGLLDGFAVGGLVKDVVQPECIEHYIAICEDAPKVVYIERDLNDIRACQVLKGWADLPDPALWDGRLRGIADDRITYQELTTDPTCVVRLVRRLGMTAAPVSWINRKFVQKTRETEKKILEFRQK